MYKVFSSLKVFAVAVFAGIVFIADSVQAVTLIEDFSDSPFVEDGGIFSIVGPGINQFTYQEGDAPAFDGDPSGSLTVQYDTSKPTTRFSAPLGITVTHEDSFTFEAIMTINSEGYVPDPYGYAEMAFGLTNALTTGTDRTGDPSDYAGDTFNMVEFDYFPNVSPWWGGPYVTLTLFGEEVSGNCFYNMVFTSSEFSLPLDTPLYVQVSYDGTTKILTGAVYNITAIAIDGSMTMTDLEVGIPPQNIFDPWQIGWWVAPIQGGFSVDTISISAYLDGWAWGGPSVLATVAYDLLFFTTIGEESVSPVINTVSINPDVIWPPNGKDVPVTVTVDVTDVDGNLKSIALLVTDEYGDNQAIDYTVADGSGGIYDIVVNLEAWRDGKDSDGRLYTIDVVATDTEGLADSTSEWEDAPTILVPHDMGD